jgi:hypothetical protein
MKVLLRCHVLGYLREEQTKKQKQNKIKGKQKREIFTDTHEAGASGPKWMVHT